MKLYEYEVFPHPRCVRMFLAEKGIEIERVQVDVPAGEHRSVGFLKKNPDATVPLLELDNGEYISETAAISRYFEEKYPEPALMGKGCEECAKVDMWQRKAYSSLMSAVATYFHHATEGLGEKDRYRNKEWGEQNKDNAIAAMKKLDEQLANNKFIVGNTFSIADITAVCAIDFAKVVGMEIPEECEHLNRWYGEVSQRESASA